MNRSVKTGLGLLACAAVWPAVAGEISYLNQFRNLAYTQTDNLTLNAQGAFFSASAVVSDQATAAYAGGTMTIGDPDTGASYALTSNDGGHSFGLQTPTLPSQAAMDAQFPLASAYTFVLTNGTDSASADMTVGANTYAAAPPMLTGNGFAALQGMDSTQPLSLSFSPFDAVAGADFEFIFFSIYDYTVATWLYPLGFAPRTTPGLTLAAGLLAPGHDYAFELIYDVRVNLPGSGADFPPQAGFDLRTSGLFTTAVPEPATWALWLLGLAGLVRTSRRAGSSRR
jgi:MYXO-CTERM domain-containing protein